MARNSGRSVTKMLALISLALALAPTKSAGSCGLERAALVQLERVDDPLALRALTRRVHIQVSCSLCHLARFGGPRNEFGTAADVLLNLSDRDDPVRQREVGARIQFLLANPSLENSPTFGEVFQYGEFPGTFLNRAPRLKVGVAKVSQRISAEEARGLVQQVEASSKFGILQVATTDEISPEVAIELAKFQGDTLILGIRSLSQEVASELAKSRVATLWLPSITSVSPEAAAALVALPGNLVLTGLVTLDSLLLAEKLASRPGALSFPFLKTLTPEIAAVLARHEGSLTLGGLDEVPVKVQQELSLASGLVSLPTLESIDVEELVEKLSGSAVFLPRLKAITPEQARLFSEVKGAGSFFGGVFLPLEVMEPEVAEVFAQTENQINLILLGNGSISDEALTVLMKTRANLILQDLETLTPSQVRIIVESPAGGKANPGVLPSVPLLLPSLKRLDSASLAEKLGPTGFPGVLSISPAAAEALGNLPEVQVTRPDGSVEIRRSGELKFPSLEELAPETVRLLMKRRWLSVSLPALEDVSLESVRLLARQTAQLSLGISALPNDFAWALTEAPEDADSGGGSLLLPGLRDVSPEAARILITGLNRGVVDLGSNHLRRSNSPKLYLGGDFGFSGRGFPRLSPELAAELAKYEGILAIQGLRELPDDAATELASFPGPYLMLTGEAVQELSPVAAASLARIPGVLQIHLQRLDSLPLAQRFASQIQWTLNHLEIVTAESADALSQYKQFFDLRSLKVLESPVMARRFVDGTTAASSITLPALETLTPETAAILASGSKPLFLGLIVLDSSEIAEALSRATSGVKLPRLRAATPQVLEILRDSASIQTPPLESIYVLTPEK